MYAVSLPGLFWKVYFARLIEVNFNIAAKAFMCKEHVCFEIVLLKYRKIPNLSPPEYKPPEYKPPNH